MKDTIELKAFMSCKECRNEELGVGVSTDNELVVVCNKCHAVVAAFSAWPDESVTQCNDCDCETCDTGKPNRESLN